MARRMPPRHKSGPKKGRFMKRGSSSPKRRRRNPAPAARRRTYRRNAPIRAKGLIKDLTDGAIGAAQVLGGKAAVRITADMLPPNLKEGPMMGPALQLALAIILGKVAEGFLSKQAAHMILIGGMLAPVEQVIVQANVPLLSPALSSYPQLSAYPQLHHANDPLALAAYPSASYDIEGGYGAGGYG